jgi:hypothetical protein
MKSWFEDIHTLTVSSSKGQGYLDLCLLIFAVFGSLYNRPGNLVFSHARFSVTLTRSYTILLQPFDSSLFPGPCHGAVSTQKLPSVDGRDPLYNKHLLINCPLP